MTTARHVLDPGELAAGGPALPLLLLATALAAVLTARIGLAALVTTLTLVLRVVPAPWPASGGHDRGGRRGPDTRCWIERLPSMAAGAAPRLLRPLVVMVLSTGSAAAAPLAATAAVPAPRVVAAATTTRPAAVEPTAAQPGDVPASWSTSAADPVGHDGPSAAALRRPRGATTTGGVGGGAVPSAGWTVTGAPPRAPRRAPDAQQPSGGWVAPRPPKPPVDLPDPGLVVAAGWRSPHEAHDASRTVTVRRGDTLWSIAARHLGAGASDAEVQQACTRWWRRNLATVGHEPDRLLPGTRLTAPSGASTDGDRPVRVGSSDGRAVRR